MLFLLFERGQEIKLSATRCPAGLLILSANNVNKKVVHIWTGMPRHKSVILNASLGADSGFDGICETQGACRGAVCLVKSRKKIVANDENYALAA